MRWKNLFALLFILAALLCLPTPTFAQEYSFSLDQEVVDVWINQDGSASLEYWFTFTCDAGAHPIDVVDVGLPNGNYALSGIRGDVDGEPIDRVDGDYQGAGGYGVAVWLGGATIEPGQSGTVHVVVDRVGGVVYPNSEDAEYADTQFSPTWFGSQYVHGTTDLTVRFHLPPGVQSEEPRWYRSPSGWPQEQPDTALDADGRVLYTWRNATAEPDRQYTFGASFPRQYVAEDAIQKPPEQSPPQEPSAAAPFGAALTSVLGCCCNPVSIVFAVIVGVLALSVWGQRQRKMQYLPPSMKVEGVGIKRGLTAVEAAILLETPLDKALTMVLFGLLKKRAVTVLEDDPLKIQINEPRPENLHPYEVEFLEAVKTDGTLSEKQLQELMVNLVKGVNNKMKGFSRKESMAYYRDIVRRAWQEVEGAETPEVRAQRFDEQLEWTMLDDDFERRTGRTFDTGPIFVPVWWNNYRPWARTATSQPAPAPSSTGGGVRPSGPVSRPTLPGAAFAATLVRGVENTAGRIVGNVTGFTGRVTQVTNPPPKPSASGRSSGGGRSCACACACACAGCACACAGGGR